MSDNVFAALADAFPEVEFETVLDSHQDVAHVPAEQYADFVRTAHDAGFDVFSDLCGVDYLRRDPRFEVVLNILSHEHARRLRIRVGVSAADPVVPSICSVFPGANYYERETFDLFGITFDGHPDLTRILLPDDWEGHPLRKDYSVGSVPVRFKESPKAQ
ncbi:MAG: NADH-quinone oxidoreductase subunit C [bacterium]|nr:NADH-quinone oxidoreductase subunit C [bacterium]